MINIAASALDEEVFNLQTRKDKLSELFCLFVLLSTRGNQVNDQFTECNW